MNKLPIAITTGDNDGIGAEITFKALDFLKPNPKDIIIIGKKISNDYKTFEIDENEIGEASFLGLKTACELFKEKKIRGIVTAPVSKEKLHKSGHFYCGQTEILEKFLAHDSQKAEMLFCANDLRVLLLTRHIALKDINLNENEVIEKILRLNEALNKHFKTKNPKFALCGLNPHAGEDGILGNEELDILIPAVKKLRSMNINITDPTPADGLFAKAAKLYRNNKKQEFDCIISNYHDQGLIPIKAIAQEEAVNITIGLDVIRTSPAHGTANDIYGKNIANAKSMICAIKSLGSVGNGEIN